MSCNVSAQPTTEQAVAMLPDGDRIHTFRASARLLVGWHRDRAEVIEVIESSGAKLSGPFATMLGHGIASVDEHGLLFIATEGDR